MRSSLAVPIWRSLGISAWDSPCRWNTAARPARLSVTPAILAAPPDLPRTRSGELSEIAMGDALHGRTVTNTGALENPPVLQWFNTFGTG